jgi:hypothetical protein
MLKKILVGLVALVVVLGIGGFFLKGNLDSIVRSAIETYGAAATQTAVKLDQVKIGLASGDAALAGLSVGSPAGFASDKSLYLGNIAVKIDTSSLAGDGPIVIKDINIEKPQITYEVDNKGENNLKTLMRNTQAYAASFGGGKNKAKKPEAVENKQPGRKIVILNLTVQGGQISITQAMLKGKKLSANLPLIHLTNIGKSEGGATPAEVTQKVLGAITESASKIASSSLAKELGANLSGAASDAEDQVKGLLGK